MAERDEGKAGALPKELVGVDWEDSFFVGYSLTCPACENAFCYTFK